MSPLIHPRSLLLLGLFVFTAACVQASAVSDEPTSETSGTTATSTSTSSTGGETTSNTTPTGTTPTCPDNTCTLGDFVCNGPSTVLFCEPDTQGCGTLILIETCLDGSSCVDGQCLAGCVDTDNDGYGEGCAAGIDCDDTDPGRYDGAPEICDGVDNNCNGQTDEGDACALDCSDQLCAPGTRLCLDDFTLRSCETNPVDGCGTWGETITCPGGCVDGACVENCQDNDNDGRGENCSLGGDCNDNNPNVYEGNTEICDGVDNNCVEGADETFPEVGQSCTSGVGSCAATGVYQCAVGGNGVVCSATANQPITELCGDLQDNDCDGQIDEGFESVGQSCADGVGECRREGQLECNGDRVRCSVFSGTPRAEVCDGIDNNCDGNIDDGGVCTTCREDANEPNNSSLTGTSLPRGASSANTLCGSNDNTHRDWFALGFFNAGETITVSIDFDNPETSLHLELFTLNFKTNTSNTSSSHSLTFTADESANYHVMVYAVQNPVSGTPYTISQP